MPRFHHQFLDLHAIDTMEPENESSHSSDSSDSLTPGFVSDKDDAIDGADIGVAADVEFMNQVLPVTLRRIQEVRAQRSRKNRVAAEM